MSLMASVPTLFAARLSSDEPAPRSPAEPPEPPYGIGEAGGSARRTYERRRQAYDAQRAGRLRKAVPRARRSRWCSRL